MKKSYCITESNVTAPYINNLETTVQITEMVDNNNFFVTCHNLCKVK